MFQIEWKEKALEELDKLEVVISRRIIKSVDELKENPFSKDIKKLKGIDAYRLRVGDYRILLEIEKDLIVILKVGHRKHIYDI
jgi:mRNA interferase RelE/StbE